MIYFTADTHISHKNIIEFCGRPFNDVHSMNKHITESWNKIVGPDDEIYHLGDFSFSMTKKNVRHVMGMLNGKKYIIKGNHDRTNILNNLQNSGLIEWWKYCHDFYYDYDNKQYHIILSHYPHYPIKGSNVICLFGHIHQHTIVDNINGIMLNVGVDNVGYDPISIVSIIEYYKNNMNYHYTKDVVVS